jgi:hypothetical protein
LTQRHTSQEAASLADRPFRGAMYKKILANKLWLGQRLNYIKFLSNSKREFPILFLYNFSSRFCFRVGLPL